MKGPASVDVLIIGAGINGAGLFRDLCEQGVSCVIIDKSDFGSGTSAAPSRLIHGGIKYLETGELRLVAQSTLERNLLLKNAPHAVTPLPTVIPIFSWLKGTMAAIRTLFGSTTAPRSRGAVLIKIGLAMYDFYGARHRVMPRHAMWSRKTAHQKIPPLTPRIVAAGTYYDAKVSHPERLVLELIEDGIRANPASRAFNHVRLERGEGDAIAFVDADGQRQMVTPKIVVNAAGPWIDKVNEFLGAPSRLIGGTKGSHVLLDHPELIKALDGRMIYFEADDGRICLVFDYLGKALVGSTDIRHSDPDNVSCDDREIDYFLQSLAGLLPGLSFERSQIVYAYSGIRPLPATDGIAPGLISRDHSAPVIEADGIRGWPIISLVGGKWTTFRGFAEEVCDTVLARLGHKRKISTHDLPIGGGRGFPSPRGRDDWIDKIANSTGATKTRVGVLLNRYGSKAEAIALAEAHNPTFFQDAPDYSHEEISWVAANERVVHLEDMVVRRTDLAITGRLSSRDISRMSEICAITFGWEEYRRKSELNKVRQLLASRHRVEIS